MESNVCISGNCGNIQQNDDKGKTDKNGQIPDIVGKGVITDKKVTAEANLDDFKATSNEVKINSTTEQTLNITTPDGAIYLATAQRTVTNLDGDKLRDTNANGVNTIVTATPYVVKELLPPMPPLPIEKKKPEEQ